ncbi:MAG: hypothetical protein NDI70_08745, partial [Pseudomonas sagittaria]|nr:hypothetical protein [Pseudomonas sagittaria]
FRQVLEILMVLTSHDAGTDQGDTQWLGQGGFLLLLWRAGWGQVHPSAPQQSRTLFHFFAR